MQYLKGRAGDPYVLGVFTASGTVNMATGRIPFAPGDFTPILRIQVDPFLVAVREESPFRTLGDLIEAARERPGEVSMSGFGAASAHFLGFQRLRAAAGDPDIRWIAYEGSGDAVVAALGGHTDAAHTNYNIVREHLRAGTMRVLAVALPLTALRDTPTYLDEGYDLTPVHWRAWWGLPASPRRSAPIFGSGCSRPSGRRVSRNTWPGRRWNTRSWTTRTPLGPGSPRKSKPAARCWAGWDFS